MTTHRPPGYTRRRFLGAAAATASSVVFARSARARDPHLLLWIPPRMSPQGTSALEMFLRKTSAWGARYGFRVSPASTPSVFRNQVHDFDGCIFYSPFASREEMGDPGIDNESRREILQSVRKQAKPVIACHGAAAFFPSPGPGRQHQDKRDPFTEMLGGEIVSSGPLQKGRQLVVDRTFPSLSAFGPALEIEDRFLSFKNFEDDIHVVLVQETEGMEGSAFGRPPFPCTWLRFFGQGRVFYTSLGHAGSSWEQEELKRVFLGGLFWAIRDLELDVSSNLRFAAPRANMSIYPL